MHRLNATNEVLMFNMFLDSQLWQFLI